MYTIPVDDVKLEEELDIISNWLLTNLGRPASSSDNLNHVNFDKNHCWYFNGWCYFFLNKEDMLAFKLRFMI